MLRNVAIRQYVGYRDHLLRHRHVRDVLAPDRRRPGGHRHERDSHLGRAVDGAAREFRDHRPSGDSCNLADAGGGRLAGRGAPEGNVWRRIDRAGVGRCPAEAIRFALEPLRSHRDDDLFDAVPGGGGNGAVPIGLADTQHERLYPQREPCSDAPSAKWANCTSADGGLPWVTYIAPT